MTTANDPYVMLHKVMTDAFTEEDLQSMCFELGEDPENIGGDTKVLRCWKMITYFRQRERLPDLMGRVEANRPNLADELEAVKKALGAMTPAQVTNATSAAAAAAASEPATAPATQQPQPAATTSTPATTSLHDIVRKYAKSLMVEGVFFLGAIPKDRLENAYASYAGDAKTNGENPLVMMDISVVFNGGAGMLLTEKAIYYKESITNGRFQISLADVFTITTRKDIFGKVILLNGNASIQASSLNDEQMQTMVQMLAECAGVKE